MTERELWDRFAMAAVTGLMASQSYTPPRVAQWAYDCAEACIKERRERIEAARTTTDADEAPRVDMSLHEAAEAYTVGDRDPLEIEEEVSRWGQWWKDRQRRKKE